MERSRKVTQWIVLIHAEAVLGFLLPQGLKEPIPVRLSQVSKSLCVNPIESLPIPSEIHQT